MTNRAHRIAVVGAGPAGFYATGHLLDAATGLGHQTHAACPR
ncbi:MAG: hypothetical protein ACR2J9_06425 [Gaiellales bacterium]